jgi:HTH-type transcriptional regulator/antitoxin HigA
MDVKPIKTEADFRATMAEIESLWNAEPGSPEGYRLEILLALVESYEARHHPIPPSDPIDAIEFMMDQRGLTRRDLEPLIDHRGRVAEVLNRKRPLTIDMIRRLSAELHIPAEILIRDYELNRAA